MLINSFNKLNKIPKLFFINFGINKKKRFEKTMNKTDTE